MIIKNHLNDDKLKYYLVNYLNDIEYTRQLSKKKELYLDFFKFIFNDLSCLDLIKSDYKFNNLISKLINTTLHSFLNETDYNNIYAKFSKIKTNKQIFENGKQIKQILI